MKRLLLVLLLVGGLCQAQESEKNKNTESKPEAKSEVAKEPAVYKFDFSVYELQNAKKSNVRNYSMILKEGPMGTIKVGNRVPVFNSKDSNSFSYYDVGLTLACRFTERDGGALLDYMNFELGSLVTPEQGTDTHITAPVIRQLRGDAGGLVARGKPTVIVSIDDTNTPRTVQVEVTATKLK